MSALIVAGVRSEQKFSVSTICAVPVFPIISNPSILYFFPVVPSLLAFTTLYINCFIYSIVSLLANWSVSSIFLSYVVVLLLVSTIFSTICGFNIFPLLDISVSACKC